jgi:uncharacterized protein YdiU (UPF0061 family)
VFSSIDRHGRYAFGNQPQAGAWNLARLAETLLPLIDDQPERAVQLATEVISAFAEAFTAARLAGLRRKLGLSAGEAGDSALAEDLLDVMQRNHADFTLTFRGLCDAAESPQADTTLGRLFENPRDYADWAARWRVRLAREPGAASERAAGMRRANPGIIPRNHRIEQVIEAAVEADDLAPFDELATALSQPYEPLEGFEAYAEPPQPSERVLQTFCGT